MWKEYHKSYNRSRNALINKLTPLGFQDLGRDIFRYEVFGGQRFDLDLSAINPDCVIKVILQEVYKTGRSDGEIDMKEKIKDLL